MARQNARKRKRRLKQLKRRHSTSFFLRGERKEKFAYDERQIIARRRTTRVRPRSAVFEKRASKSRKFDVWDRKISSQFRKQFERTKKKNGSRFTGRLLVSYNYKGRRETRTFYLTRHVGVQGKESFEKALNDWKREFFLNSSYGINKYLKSSRQLKSISVNGIFFEQAKAKSFTNTSKTSKGGKRGRKA